MSDSKYNIKSIIRKFCIPADFVSAEPYGSGHINDTYAVDCNQGGTAIRYLLQRINHNIFKDPKRLMKNSAKPVGSNISGPHRLTKKNNAWSTYWMDCGYFLHFYQSIFVYGK